MCNYPLALNVTLCLFSSHWWGNFFFFTYLKTVRNSIFYQPWYSILFTRGWIRFLVHLQTMLHCPALLPNFLVNLELTSCEGILKNNQNSYCLVIVARAYFTKPDSLPPRANIKDCLSQCLHQTNYIVTLLTPQRTIWCIGICAGRMP